jgi:uncharacterized protein involved in exopolysaccharide biosynthesis
MTRAPDEVPRAARAAPARGLPALLWRGKLTLALVFLLVTGVVAFEALGTPPLFAAEASLVVRVGREYAYRPETGGNDSVRMPSLSEMVNSEVEILTSRDLAEQVVRQLGVAALFPELVELEPDPDLAVERGVLLLRQATKVRPVLESSVIKVEIDHPDARLAAEAVNLLVERFTDKHVEVFGEEGAQRFEDELVRRRQELAAADQALAAFKLENGLSDLDRQRELLLGRRVELQQALATAEQELAALPPIPAPADEPCTLALPPGLAPEMQGELLRQRGDLERELRELAPPISDWLVEQASMRALDLELEERQLLANYGESSRRVQSVRAELEHVRAFLADAQRRAAGGPDPEQERAARAADLRAEIERVQGQLELLTRAQLAQRDFELRERARVLGLQRADTLQRLSEVGADLGALAEHETDLLRLERDQHEAELLVTTCAQRADEARIGAELDREKLINVRVIERAAPSVVPLGLSLALKLALGAFLGLLAGSGTVVLLDVFRGRD